MMAKKLWPALLLFGLLQQAGGQETTSAPAAPPAGTYRISGTVVDAISGQRLPGAQVSINASAIPDSTRMVASGEEGSFAFENLAPGKYVLSARRRGYVAQMYQQHETFSTAIVVGAGLDSENLRFELRPGASIAGDVTDDAGDPVRGASVMLFRQNVFNGIRRTHMIRQAQTDDEGHYRFWRLMPGTYFVGVSAQPWYAQHGTRRPAISVTQENGDGGFQSVDRLDATVEQNQSLVRLEPIVEQNQSLDVAYALTFFSNAKDIGGAAALTVHAGDAEIADFRLQAVPALHLLVKTATPDATQGGSVKEQVVQNVNANVNVLVVQTLTEGTMVPVNAGYTAVGPGLAEVTGVPPGRMNVDVSGNSPKGSGTMHRSQSVQLSSDTEIDATENGSGIVVSGVLRVDDGSAVPQPAQVRLRNTATGEAFDTEVAATGEFSFRNSPVGTGGYELMIVQGQGLYIKSLSSPNAKTSGRSFQIATAQDVSVTIVASQGNGRVTGFAMKDGKPAAGVMIVLAPEDLHGNPALFRRDQSDSDGSFTLGNVVSGRYTLMAIENGWDLEWADPDVMQKYVAGGEKVQLAGNGKTEMKVKVQ
jgi:Carboxypeptidase regulatory-like domain